MKCGFALVCVLLILPGSNAEAGQRTIDLTITAGKHDYKNVPITVPLDLPESFAGKNRALLSTKGERIVGQLTRPGLTTQQIRPSSSNRVRRDLHFILPELKAGATITLQCVLEKQAPISEHKLFWKKTKDYDELVELRGTESTPVLRYMRKAYDDSSSEARNKSYKVFHHLYDPSGKRFVTNGGHTLENVPTKDLLYPHHRGLMYGFNNITYDGGKRADTWHCPAKGNRQAHVEHVKTISQEAGPVLGRHRVLIEWYGAGKKPFALEEREMTVYATPGGTLVEFASLLKTNDGKVVLDGDPQHAGFQFRAHNDVAKYSRNQTYYLRVDGKGKPGQTINWSGKNSPEGTVDVPWKAMSFVLDKQRYTVAYLDHPNNPGEARHSERDYGRFGYYFEYTLTEDNPLLVNYRVWLQGGEMTGPQVEDLATGFVTPPKTTVQNN